MHLYNHPLSSLLLLSCPSLKLRHHTVWRHLTERCFGLVLNNTAVDVLFDSIVPLLSVCHDCHCIAVHFLDGLWESAPPQSKSCRRAWWRVSLTWYLSSLPSVSLSHISTAWWLASWSFHDFLLCDRDKRFVIEMIHIQGRTEKLKGGGGLMGRVRIFRKISSLWNP